MPTRIGIKKFREISSRPYVFCYWKEFDFSILKNIECRHKEGAKSVTYNNLIMMADTETSKKTTEKVWHNHIVAWSIALRTYEHNICTLWGQDPREFPEMLECILGQMEGEETYLYFHNLQYDHCFLRRFMYAHFGEPVKQLNIRPLYPLTIRYGGGLIVKDSLLLAQRSLDRWAKDLNVEHQKAVGSWDYDKLRNQSDELTEDELHYIENDVLAGVECISATMNVLHKTIASIPLTATGIPRGEARNIGKKNRAYDAYISQTPEDYAMQLMYQKIFHGGYTHNNRYTAGRVFPAKCKDFSSSYPFHAITTKVPSEKFWKMDKEVDPLYILKNADDWAFLFRMRVTGLDLQDLGFPMPSLSHAKCTGSINAIIDNGRVLRADYVEIYMNEWDFKLFCLIYKWKSIQFDEVYCAWKDYMPKWYTDYIFQCFKNKTILKGVDPVLYSIEKAKLNAIAFGVIAQQPCKADIVEEYEDNVDEDGREHKNGEYHIAKDWDALAEYARHIKNRNNFLPYHWCIYITSAAQFSLFRLAMNCIPEGEKWLYSDTDSVYATAFDEKKVEAYNKECKKKLIERGYGGVEHNGREYWLGVAEDDGDYSEFKGLHAKCYACRERESGKLKITVAGVPKKGVSCLKDDISNFHVLTCFPGTETGKLQHKHFYNDIYIDENGNVTGDSIDLSPADYLIKDENVPSVYDVYYEEVDIQVYE